MKKDYNKQKNRKVAQKKSRGIEVAQERISEIVKFFCDCLKEKGLTINKIVLFGSQAEGIPTEESDIDIIIVSEDFKRKNIFRRARLTKDAEFRTIRKFMVPLDIITMTPDEYENNNSLIAEYARGGIEVYTG